MAKTNKLFLPLGIKKKERKGEREEGRKERREGGRKKKKTSKQS